MGQDFEKIMGGCGNPSPTIFIFLCFQGFLPVVGRFSLPEWRNMCGKARSRRHMEGML